MTKQLTKPMTEHAPGPYTYHLDSDGCDDHFEIKAADGSSVARIVFWDCDDEWTARASANARLLTAAPQLLEIVRKLLGVIADIPVAELSSDFHEARFEAEAIVVRAEGRA